jgi:hypothetical protein
MSLIVPLQANPNQTVASTLGNQAVNLNVYQKLSGLYMDIYLNASLLLAGVICENANRIIRNAYFGFSGDFVWIDQQDSADPYYTGIGSRWFLVYLYASELNGDAE